MFRPLYLAAGTLFLGYLCEEFSGAESFLENVYDSLWVGLPILFGSDIYYKPRDRLDMEHSGN